MFDINEASKYKNNECINIQIDTSSDNDKEIFSKDTWGFSVAISGDMFSRVKVVSNSSLFKDHPVVSHIWSKLDLYLLKFGKDNDGIDSVAK